MKLTNEKYINSSKFFLIVEVFFSIAYSLLAIILILLSPIYFDLSMYILLSLILFLIINSFIKVLCIKNNYSFKKRAYLHLPIALYLLLIIILSLLSKDTIFCNVIFFTIIFGLNVKYNYFIKFK